MNYLSIPTTKESHVYDCIGIGFGPSNIALAIALEEFDLLENCMFLEKRDEICWHPGMLIPGTDIQHNPLRDLVTPRNPSSKYGFLQYLQANSRLFEFLNLAAHYPPRSEYAGYVNWVGSQFLEYVRLSSDVVSMNYHQSASGRRLFRVSLSSGESLLARAVSFAPGRSNNIPAAFRGLDPSRVVHLSDYLFAKERWMARDSLEILVIGGSQSAAEIVLDLVDSPSVSKVMCLTHSFGFKQKDLSAFTEEIYFPRFTDYFYSLDTQTQNKVTRELWRSNYGAADPDVIEALNLRLYEQSISGKERLSVTSNLDIVDVAHCSVADKFHVLTKERNTGTPADYEADAIILATGFKNFGDGDSQEPIHPLLLDMSDAAAFREDGGVAITRDYKMRTVGSLELPPLFINGLCEASHGFGDAGSFSLLSVRSATIAGAIRDYLAETCSSAQEEEISNAF